MPKIAIENLSFYYEITGEGDPVFLLHGLGSSTADWELQVPDFAENHQVIAVDMRGHGRSSKPSGPYSVAMFAKDTAEIIQTLNIGPVHVVGISMGGMIGFQLAIDAPKLVKSLVAANCTPELVPHTLSEKFQLWQRITIARLLGMRRMGKFLGGRLFPLPEQSGIRGIFADRWARNDKGAYLAAMNALVGWDVTGRLQEIRCPTLVISADQDYTPVAVKELYSAQIPNARLKVIPNSRHATPADQPALFNAAVLEFWQQQAITSP